MQVPAVSQPVSSTEAVKVCFFAALSKDEFLRLFRGRVDIYAQAGGEETEMWTNISGHDTEDVVAQMNRIFQFSDDNWSRRYYGRRLHKNRDCAYIDVDKDHKQRKNITFRWKVKKVTQYIISGEKISYSMPKLTISFPRQVAVVAPSKKHKMAFKAAVKRVREEKILTRKPKRHAKACTQ